MDINSSLSKEEFSDLLAKAEKGDPEAQYAVGVAYRNGWGVNKDWDTAFSWLTKACESGNIDAQSFIRKMYPLVILKKFARRGNAHAQVFIGNMYAAGYCVEQNYSHAIGWYRKAFKNGHTQAAGLIADSYKHMADELEGQISELSKKRDKYREFYFLWVAMGLEANDSECVAKLRENYQDYLKSFKNSDSCYDSDELIDILPRKDD